MRNVFSILILLLTITFSCNTYQLPVQSEVAQYRMNRSLDSSIKHPVEDLIAPYKKELDVEMNEIIGYASMSLTKQQPESSLGSWVANATQAQAVLLTRTKIDASIQYYGSIRIQELTKGEIRLGKIYELMPYDNMLVIVEMNGEIAQQLFDQMAADGGWPVSKEVRFKIRNGKATKLMINNQAVDKNHIYHITMPDYLANGNAGCGFLIGLKREETGVLVRDLLIKEVKDRHQ